MEEEEIRLGWAYQSPRTVDVVHGIRESVCGYSTRWYNCVLHRVKLLCPRARARRNDFRYNKGVLPPPRCFCFRAGRRLWPCGPRAADTVTLLIYSQQSHREIVSFATFQWLATSKLRMKYRDIGNQEQREEGSEVSHQHASQSLSLICGVFLSWSR